jgi:alkylated DNA repair dioxygenase AlkB
MKKENVSNLLPHAAFSLPAHFSSVAAVMTLGFSNDESASGPSSRLVQLASSSNFHPVALDDGWAMYNANFVPAAEATALQYQLETEIPWRVHPVRLFGKVHPSPRLCSWHGLGGASYRYSGVTHSPLPLTPSIQRVLDLLQQQLELSFNSVLANLYRNGSDRMGLHADDEKELGPQPLIASVSFGATRKFVLKHRYNKAMRHELQLTHGSVLLMGGTLQSFWKHEIPRASKVDSPRINLTFRTVLT